MKLGMGTAKRVLPGVLAVLVVALAVAIGVLQQVPSLRQKWFAKFCTCMSESSESEMQPIRCNLLKNIHGDILEIGPGPGPNFACFNGNEMIKSYTGLEPNVNFHPLLLEKRQKMRLTFPITFKAMRGEAMDVEDESMDCVVVTHVLCSVQNMTQVLDEVARVLKPGGTFFFLEHVKAPRRTTMRWIQEKISPVWEIITDGCKFMDTERALRAHDSFRRLLLKQIDAPMPLAIVKPHILGTAKRR